MMSLSIFSSEDFYIEIEPSVVPWLKLFSHVEYKELTDMPQKLRERFYMLCDEVELWMCAYFKPDKINRASFGNYLPRVHVHIMARFKEDDYFPEPLWGKRQRRRQEAFVFSSEAIASLHEALKAKA